MGYFLSGIVAGAAIFGLAWFFVTTNEPEITTRCVINTHLTPEQYTEAIGKSDQTEFWGVVNGDVLVLEPCK